MITNEIIIGLLSSFIGTFGFSLIFRLRPKYLLPASFGGMLAYAIYLVCDTFGMHIFLSNFIAAASAALYSELLARAMKGPSILFSLPCLIPLVPGSSLYYTMSNLLNGEYTLSFDFLVNTLLIALGIAGGFILISVLFSAMSGFFEKRAN